MGERGGERGGECGEWLGWCGRTGLGQCGGGGAAVRAAVCGVSLNGDCCGATAVWVVGGSLTIQSVV